MIVPTFDIATFLRKQPTDSVLFSRLLPFRTSTRARHFLSGEISLCVACKQVATPPIFETQAALVTTLTYLPSNHLTSEKLWKIPWQTRSRLRTAVTALHPKTPRLQKSTNQLLSYYEPRAYKTTGSSNLRLASRPMLERSSHM